MTARRSTFALLLSALLAIAAPRAIAQCVSLTTLGSAYTQNFDTLSNTAGSTTNNLTITGWFLTEGGGGTRDNEQYAVDTGGSNTGDMYSYGAAAATERALGQLRSGTLIPLFGSCYTNNTGSTIASLDVNYFGEEWRLGTAARTDQMNFEYSTNATDLVTGTWTNVAALNFVTPDTATAGAKNGNAAGDRTNKVATISSLSIANGATFWIRWNDADASGADDGLAVDDFSLTPQGGVSLPNLTINDIPLSEGNAGTTSFTFTVSLSAPAGAGGVTFDIATADNTATQPGDYTQKSLTGQTIPAGSSTYSFTVLVNGDTTPETNETFFVNVTNVTGANVTDGQGQGTINNDDAAPNLTIDDVPLAEGNAGTTTFTFTVSLSSPAPAGGVTFDIATANNTAVAPGDYTAKSLTSQTIPAGSSTYTFDVLVNGDTSVESNETFFVNVANITNAIGTDTQGLGTINNDDFTPIHDIQGNGNSSPIVGASVITRGIVTGLRSNGFFLQEPDASVDADPATSEGVLVFTSSAPPVAAAIGAYVQVSGTVAEFIPSADPLQPPVTELTSPTVVQLSTGNPLPAPIPLTATFPDPAGSYDQLERVEGMRVSVASLTTSSPTQGNSTNEPNATQTSNGVFFGTVTGVARPAREPGIQAPDPAPSGGSIPPIPRFDANPEMIRVDSDGLVGAPLLDVDSLATVTGLTGPLDYTFRHYTILPDPTLPAPIAAGGISPTAATAATSQEFTVGSYNIERFFDTVNDPAIGEPVLTATAYNNRLNKVSLGIRNNLLMPDIIGMVEVENLTTLQDIATRVNNDAVAAAQPNPMYVAYLSEGNDVGGIDVGFLVKTAPVVGSTPRVTVNAVVQENAGELFVNPDSSTDLLNDRPPLRLDAVVNHANGATFPVQVIVNHLRSLLSVNDESAGSSGWPTAGARVRAKRQKQAESLANLVQLRQTNNPAENIILVGDFNAYEFNDGLADTMDTIAGTPVPDNETAVPGDGTDLVNPNLDNLFDTPPLGQRYSYVFDGQMQNIDHEVVNAALIAATTARRIEHPRINTDFRATDRNDPNTPRHLSDHDPIVGFYAVQAFSSAEVSLTKSDSPDPVNAGSNLTYTIAITNNGPDPADNASWSDTLPAGTTFVSFTQPGGWTCSTPSVGGTGAVSCSLASFAVGTANFTIVVNVNPNVAGGTVLSNTATFTSTTSDPTTGNESATETTTVSTSADLQLSKTDTPDPVTAGSNLSYTLTLTNNGPSNAANATFTDTLPAGTTFVSLSTTGPWSCTTPAVGATGTVSCTNTSFGVTADFFTLVVKVDPSVAAGTVLSNTATLSSSTSDPNSGNDSDTATTTVSASSDLQITKTDTPDPVNAGALITYTVTVTNAGPSNSANVTLTDTTPPGTTFAFLAAPGAWVCPVPPASGPVVCTHASLPVGVSVFTIKVIVDSSTASGTVLTNTAQVTSASTTDPNGANNSDSVTTTVATSADLQITKVDTPDPVTAGNNLTYTVGITNAGPSDAANLTFTDTVPANTTFVSLSAAGWSCTTPAVGGTGSISCTRSAMTASASQNLTLVVNVDPGTSTGTVISNTANISTSTTDPNGANNSATATTTVGTGSAELSIAKSDSPDPVVAGTNLTYSISVANAGPTNATTASWTDTLPTGTTFVSLSQPGGWSCTTPAVGGTGTVTCSIASLAATAAPFTLVVAVDPALASGTVLTNTANVSSATTDPNGTNNSATTTTTVNSSADVQIAKIDTPDPVTPGTNITYTITVTNAGPSSATSLSLSDTVPTGTTFVSLASPAGWSCTAPAAGGTGAISCTAATLAPGNAVFTLVVNANPSLTNGTVITNNATVATTTTDPNGTNNSATTTTTVGVGSADLSISKTDSPDPVNAGANLTYTITVNNAGPTNASSVSLSDTLPSNTTFVSMAAPAGWVCVNPAVGATGTVTCTNPSVATGSNVFTLVVKVANVIAPGSTISNTATVSTTTADPNTGNESATATTTVASPANVSGTKTVTGTFVPSGAVVYTITLTNSGPSTQQDNAGNEFIDVLPPSLTLVSATATSGTAVATVGTNTVTWNGSIAAASSVTITINATINSNVTPGTTISNQGTINYDADGNGTNESARQTDSPSAPGAADATTFVIAAAPAIEAIPTLDEMALMALAVLLAMAAALVLKK